MKLNFINKVYVGLAIILLALCIHKIWAYKASERFYYYGNVSAPASYPVYVESIDFILPNDELDIGFYQSRDEVNSFNTDWGRQYYFPEVHEPLFLPTKLALNYVSYREQQFYRDTLDLPKEALLSTFKKAVKEKQTIEMYNANMHKQGLMFVVGIANNGNVIIWLRGQNFEKVLTKKKLEPYQPKPRDFDYQQQKFATKNEYMKSVFEWLPDSLKALYKNGYDADANYIDSPSKYLQLK